MVDMMRVLLLIALLVCTVVSQINGPSPTAVLPCTGTQNQQWIFNADGSISPSDGRCLDVGDCDKTAGDAELIVYPCGSGLCNGANQQFIYNSDSSIQTKLDGQCIDLNVNDGKVQTWPCSGANNQKWQRKGSLLVNQQTSGCLTVATGPVYTNPIINRDFPDPTIMRGGDGMFYVYSTQSAGCNICVSSSRDMITWSPVANAFNGASWTGNAFWAPDVTLHNGTYYMYYAGSRAGTNLMCIGLALSPNPLGPFQDIGNPLICSSNSNPFEAIDPKSFDAPDGNTYLYWGSDLIPIQVQRLDPSRRSFAAGTNPISIIPTSSLPYENLVEGAWVTYNLRASGYYFVWYSGDNCCNPNAHYAVSVARSTSPTGPFEKLGHPILVLDARWNAPGHCSIITDDAGQDWIFYHAMDAPSGDQSRKLLMDRIVYINDWPQIAPGGPSDSPQFGPYVA